MSLTEQEKIGLRDQLAALIEANEPEAMLATLQRVCERKASSGGLMLSEQEASRWRALGESCQRVAQELETANAPKRAQPADNEAREPQAG